MAFNPANLAGHFTFRFTTHSLVAGTLVQVLTGDNRRIALTFSSIGAHTYVNFKTFSAAEAGMPVLSSSPPWTLLFKDHGSMVGSEWYALPATINTQLQIWELIWLP